jgi:CspA family cold shock protein
MSGNSSAAPVDGDRKIGTVKWFDDAKGYGFITPVGKNPGRGRDVFVHYSAINDERQGRRKKLDEGGRVEFDIVQGEKGLQAADVRPVR